MNIKVHGLGRIFLLNSFFVALTVLLIGFFALHAGAVSNTADPYATIKGGATTSEIQKIVDSVYAEYQDTGGYVAYAKLKLLEKKYGIRPTQESDYYGYYYYPRPTGMSLLDDVYMESSFGGSSRGGYDFSNGIDFLTGKHAADETFQFGRTIAPRRSIDQDSSTVNIASIQKLQVKTHPWDKMISRITEVSTPEIFKLVPADHFMAYFDGMGPINALEGGFKEISSFGKHFFDVDKFTNFKSEIADRLGIKEVKPLDALVSEMVFVSEDLSFIPKTNFAVVVSLKKGSLSDIEALVSKENKYHGVVGDAYVIASSRELYERIRDTYAGKNRSMKDARDVTYAYSVLDSRRDGFVYFSEDFILKLVGPEYRINAGRRATTLSTLNNLQYTVFAYRSITGSWPKTLVQIGDEGYGDKIYLQTLVAQGYSVDADGRVRHKDWGTLYDIEAVYDVPIEKVSQDEADRYEQFRQGYESYWREFFDPIGIAVTASDYLYFHTIILPLIDETNYQSAKRAAGGEPSEFEGLKNPLRSAPMLFLSKFNFDEVLFAMYDSFGVARMKAADAGVIANISSLRVGAELYRDSRNGYDTSGKTKNNPNKSCSSGLFADQRIASSLKGAQDISGHNAVCYSEKDSYAISIELKTQGIHYCIDGMGPAVQIGAPITGTTCGTALSPQELTRLQNEASSQDTKPSIEERRKAVNEYIWEEWDFEDFGYSKEEFNIFGVVGDELQVGIGESLPLELENIADYDVYFALKLADTERMKKFINAVYRSIAREMGGNNFGFFSISTDEPIKNTYNDVEYYMIPTGFVNLYFVYYQDYLYVSISQKAINGLIDSATIEDRTGLITPVQRRAIEFVGDTHNMMFSADVTPFSNYKKQLISSVYDQSYIASYQAKKLRGYFADYRYIQESFGGSSVSAPSFFDLPNSFGGLPLYIEDGDMLLGKERYPFSQVDFSRDGISLPVVGGESAQSQEPNSKKFKEFFSEEDKSKMLDDFDKFKGFTVALSFTPEGLDTKVAIKNPLVKKEDSRFSASTWKGQKIILSPYLFVVGGVFALLVAAGVVVFAVKRRRGRKEEIVSVADDEYSTGVSSPTETKTADALTHKPEDISHRAAYPAQDERGIGEQDNMQGPAVSAAPPEDSLRVYVKEARATGISDAAISDALKDAGWSEGDIARALEV